MSFESQFLIYNLDRKISIFIKYFEKERRFIVWAFFNMWFHDIIKMDYNF